MQHSNRINHKRHVSPYRVTMMSLVAVGFILLSLGLLFVLIAGPLRRSQEIRNRAMVSNGTAELSFSPTADTQFAPNVDQTIDIKLNTKGLQTYVTQLVFDVITNETTDSLEVSFNEGSGQKKAFLDVQPVTHGYHVRFIGLPPQVSRDSYFSSSSPVTILTLKFKPKKTGTMEVNFDLGRSQVLIGTSDANQYADQLHTQEVIHYPIKESTGSTTTQTSTATPTPTPSSGSSGDKDDLFFYAINDENNKLEVFQDGTTNLVNLSDLKSGSTYKAVYKTRIQNVIKNADAPDKKVDVQLKINNLTTLVGSVSYRDINRDSTGSVVTISGVFTAQSSNKFVAKIDPDNQYDEKKEDNNEWSTEASQNSSNNSSAKNCNDTCDSNSQCGVNQRCFNTGTEKRCRLVTNVTSTSCQLPPDQGLQRTCNEYCADSRECASGYTCWYNKCRLPNNLNSVSCQVVRSSSTTGTTKGGLPASQPAITGCNQNCKTNRDCSAGLRCYSGSCRYPLNLNSVDCSADAGGTTTTATPKPTATPKMSSTSSAQPTNIPTIAPTSAPSALPEATPNESSLDTIGLFLSTYFGSLNEMPSIMGVPAPLLLMGVGLFLLILAIIIFVIARRRRNQATHVAPAPAPFTPGPSRPNPTPSNTVLAQRETPQARLVKPAVPGTITTPPSQPTAPKAAPYIPAIQKAPVTPTPQVTPVPVQPAKPVTPPTPVAQPALISKPAVPTEPSPAYIQKIIQESLPQKIAATPVAATTAAPVKSIPTPQVAPVKPMTPPQPLRVAPVVTPQKPALAAAPEEKLLAAKPEQPEIPAHIGRQKPLTTPPAPVIPRPAAPATTPVATPNRPAATPEPGKTNTQQFSSMIERLKQKGVTVDPTKKSE